MILLRQRFPRQRVEDVGQEVARVLGGSNLGVGAPFIAPKSARIGIGVGSRGVAEIAGVVRALVAWLRGQGAEPFIFPAMGSHGGATPEGQRSVLESLGVTEDFVGAPIIASMEVDLLGHLPEGLPVYMDRVAHGADGIIVVNRIKPHTDYSGEIESGLSKMIAIGMGKHEGAIAIHSWGIHGLRDLIPEAAKFSVAHAPILGGLAVVENAYDEVAQITFVPPEGIGNGLERDLLRQAKGLMPRLPWDVLDVLVIDQMGKNISGAGMDTNIIGRLRCEGQKETAASITNVTVHDLTEESHGNSIGLGHADFTTTRLVNKIDTQSFYINGLTAGIIAVNAAKLPMVLNTDREAIAAAIRMAGRPDYTQIQLARIEHTLRLDYILASPNCLEHMRAGSDIEVLGEPQPFQVEADGSLVSFGQIRMSYA